MQVSLIFLLAALVRLILIGYGVWHDKTMDLKYTDVDYSVFTAGAQHLSEGKSPYLNAEYKYTPLLAYMLTPNIFAHELYGKFLFASFDVAVGYVIYASLAMLDYDRNHAKFLVGISWLFNPLTVAISTRGSADSVEALLVVSMIFFLLSEKFIIAGLLYGLSVHFKLYPIIYCLPVILYIGIACDRTSRKNLFDKLLSVFGKNVIRFLLASFISFAALTGVFYWRFGDDFFDAAYYYHARRIDVQHNFSPYFYLMRIYQDLPALHWIKLTAFVPQSLACLYFGLRYFQQLPAAMFLQTFAFVAFNKVCTSQYFLWYVSLFPMSYAYMRISLKNLLLLLFAWLGGQGIWLALAYELEYRGRDVLMFVWFASILFLVINVVILLRLADAVTMPSKKPALQEASPVVQPVREFYTPYGSKCLPCQGIQQRRSLRSSSGTP